MRKNASFIGVLLALAIFLTAGVMLGRRKPPELTAEYYSVCARSMDQVNAGGQGDVYDFEGIEVFDEPASFNLALYEVEGDAIVDPVFDPVPSELLDEQENFRLQNEAWLLFAGLIPPQDRAMVSQFNVFTDGPDNTLAAVDLNADDFSSWKLEVDIADLDDRDELIFTVIHEFAHLLTLNAEQVELDTDILNDPYDLELQKAKAAACSTYFTGLGCSYENSYIHAFYSRFWTDIEAEWSQVDAIQYQQGANVEYYNALYDFYLTHRDRFVSDYAVTHPTEDIAESFTHFIFSPRPVGDSVRDQKLLFFYEYPELIRLRGDILNGTCAMGE